MDIHNYIPYPRQNTQALQYTNVGSEIQLSDPSQFFKERPDSSPLMTSSSGISQPATALSSIPEDGPLPVVTTSTMVAMAPTPAITTDAIDDNLTTSITRSLPPTTNSFLSAQTVKSFHGSTSSFQSASVNPALLLSRGDKRKSSPAVLGLPYGLTDEAQLSLHLPQQRNSIEAAMLLANFNRLPTIERTPASIMERGSSVWQDDMSVAQPKTAWISNGAEHLSVGSEAVRRHSYDVNMGWKEFQQMQQQQQQRQHQQMSPFFSRETTQLSDGQRQAAMSDMGPTDTAAKLTWTQDGIMIENDETGTTRSSATDTAGEYAQMLEFIQHPVSTCPPSPPMQYSKSALTEEQQHQQAPQRGVYNASSVYPQQREYPYSLQQQQQPYTSYPAYQQQQAEPQQRSVKRGQPSDPEAYYQQHYDYRFPNASQGLNTYYYQQPTSGLKLPLPANNALQTSTTTATAMIPSVHPSAADVPRNAKRRKTKVDDDEGEVVEPGDKDFPAMSARDVEAARTDPQARPRRQKLRFDEDQYTPSWVRYNGQAKEGLCDTCSPGKWLQLKNSAYWYHKQFFHGISSVSGQPFIKPLETRWVDQDLLEGLCHQCHQWVPVSNVKRKNSVLWYRHAHKCHVYHKPKTGGPRKR